MQCFSLYFTITSYCDGLPGFFTSCLTGIPLKLGDLKEDPVLILTPLICSSYFLSKFPSGNHLMLGIETEWKLPTSRPGTRRTPVEPDLKPDHALTKTLMLMHTSWPPSSVLPPIVLELLFKQERQISRPVAFLVRPNWNQLLSCFTRIFISVHWTLGMAGGQIWSIKTTWVRLLAEDSDNTVKIFCAWAVNTDVSTGDHWRGLVYHLALLPSLGDRKQWGVHRIYLALSFFQVFIIPCQVIFPKSLYNR